MRAWLNGKLLDSPESVVLTVLDHGFIVGDGVFETVQVLEGRPFALTRHLDRLTRSAVGLRLAAPDLASLREGVAATVADQDIPFGRIRITVTSGMGPLGSLRGHHGQTSVVVTEPCPRPPSATSIVTVPWPRNERSSVAGLNTTSYAENALMVAYAAERGASEAVMPNTTGALCEGTGSNIFYVLDGEVVTPSLESGCLAGITRALLLEWCGTLIDVSERDEPIEILQRAQEVFLVSTTRDVQAVARVDDRSLAAPGRITAQLARLWARESIKDWDPQVLASAVLLASGQSRGTVPRANTTS